MNASEFVARVRQMEAAEIWFRARAAARAQAGLLAATIRTESWQRERLAGRLVSQAGSLETARERLAARDWAGAHVALSRHFRHRQSRFPLSPDNLPALAETIRATFPDAVGAAAAASDRIRSGRFDLLGYRDLSFASEGRAPGAIDWHYDPVHHRRSARGFWSKVPYLDPGNGDHKLIWELNRHQHWLTLGRAAWLTGDVRCHGEFVRQLEDWLRENAPRVGINWVSSLELSLRCLSWLWAFHLFVEGPGAADAHGESPWVVDLLLGIDRQLSQVEENLSRYFSPNTHLTGEALGLYVCGSALPELAGSRRWVQTGRDVLLDQLDRQVCADGGHAERSTHYHRYTLDYYLLALVVAGLTGDGCAGTFAEAVGRLARAARLLADDDGRLPQVGDDDGGMLFPICGRDPADVSAPLASAAALLGDAALALGNRQYEETCWLTGTVGGAGRPGVRPRALPLGAARAPRSGALPATGYYVSKRRTGDHIVIDGGPHGYLNGGHAHADALAVTMTLARQPLFIDPGTATYTMSAELRDRFRSSAMHNTLTIDGRSQSQPAGPFHWTRAADATVHRWVTASAFDYFEATHDGYLPMVHRRCLAALDDGVVVVVDSVTGEGSHELAIHWHIAPGWRVEARPARPLALTLRRPGGAAASFHATAARLELFDGDPDPGLGWSSPTFGHLVPSLTVRASVRRALPATIVTVIADASRAGLIPGGVEVRQVPEETTAAAVRLTGRDSVRLLLFTAEGPDGARVGEASGVATDGRFALVEHGRDERIARAAILDGTWLAAGDGPPLVFTESEPGVRVAYGRERD